MQICHAPSADELLLLRKPKLLLQKPKQKPDKPQHPLRVLLACRRKAAALGAQTASLFSLLELQAYNRRQRRLS